ncbi:stage V sporulation protein AD [Clostridium estertheticum]|uniref:Stage V sporulation protein AD n=1 Tax=Clostridium estertheticum TaxID=238834 RepID=A0AA47I8I6_9CLOT|nr:stage V sporulation protein AD [Clostridium estertheticum]MBU3154436.1 stage V sporulation protein AD [Clostridium estertheticum]MBW9172033.1 stage V sporulation protein AD [Clostridium estertheticum]MBX4260003.1 stage V sporulation protein AD [Clostridium estertheticum]WAG62120.1 stage V sporulation protein AD [Clostridium estertheticum]WLC72024.1 stage V sporulation protein AD [Clostridium estertheticum]
MLKGHQSWIFNSKPIILGSAAVGGPFEGNGALASDFDIIHEDLWVGQDSFEKAEKVMLEHACARAIEKSNIKKEDINFFISGDLMNQITSSSFAARTLGIPYLGIFGACSSSMEGLALAAQLIDSKSAKYVMASASSHNATAEKQYRYPTEYGGQRPPTAQWTVTGAGAAVLCGEGVGPRVTSATMGRVIDMGISDPYNMGAAMAPAAVDTIEAHFRDLNIDDSYYDLIATGDLGKVGHEIAISLLKDHGIEMMPNIFTDCGLLIYKKDQPVFSGGSGCGCSATVTYGHFLNRMRRGELKRILIVATGALMSPISYQQKESIPCIAHAVSIEM